MSTSVTRRLVFTFLALAVLAAAFVAYRKLGRPTEATRSPAAAQAAKATDKVAAKDAPPAAATAAADADFKSSLERARLLVDPRQRAREFGRLLQLWLERDPEGALAYVRELPRQSAEFTQGLLLTLDVISRRDPDRALTLASEWVATREQRFFYNALFARLAEQDAPAAARRLARVPAGEAHDFALRAVAETWARQDASAALAWAQKLEGGDRMIAVETAVSELASSDPLHAIQIAQQTLSGTALDRTLATALHRLVATDPQSAAAIVPMLPPGEVQKSAAVEIVRALAARSPLDAINWAKSLPASGEIRSTAILRAVETWTATDPAAASEYVLTLSPDSGQRAAALLVADVLAGTNPQNAITWAQSLPAPDTRTAALAHVANAWAQHDAASAAKWVVSQSDVLANVAPATLNATLSYWVLQDAPAAENFVAMLPPTAQASAAAYLAPLLAQNHPADALSWAQALADPTAREAAVAAAYARWSDNAPAAAKAWLATAELAPDVKARLQKKP